MKESVKTAHAEYVEVLLKHIGPLGQNLVDSYRRKDPKRFLRTRRSTRQLMVHDGSSGEDENRCPTSALGLFANPLSPP